jgi:D-alanyl-D-alanine carboxypeptidase
LVAALRRDFPERMGYFSIEGIVAGKKTFENFNALVGRYRGADGMKTGYICDSGFNLIGSATRDGRTLVAVVFGEKTPVSRAEKAALLLDRGFATPAGASVTLAALPRPSDRLEGPANIRATMCPKPVPGQKPVDNAENAKVEVPSPWQMPFDHAPTLMQVGLGGADGPVPLAMVNADGQEYADVPLPIWRPDMPDPTAPAAQTQLEQGDAPAAELRP